MRLLSSLGRVPILLGWIQTVRLVQPNFNLVAELGFPRAKIVLLSTALGKCIVVDERSAMWPIAETDVGPYGSDTSRTSWQDAIGSAVAVPNLTGDVFVFFEPKMFSVSSDVITQNYTSYEIAYQFVHDASQSSGWDNVKCQFNMATKFFSVLFGCFVLWYYQLGRVQILRLITRAVKYFPKGLDATCRSTLVYVTTVLKYAMSAWHGVPLHHLPEPRHDIPATDRPKQTSVHAEVPIKWIPKAELVPLQPQENGYCRLIVAEGNQSAWDAWHAYGELHHKTIIQGQMDIKYSPFLFRRGLSIFDPDCLHEWEQRYAGVLERAINDKPFYLHHRPDYPPCLLQTMRMQKNMPFGERRQLQALTFCGTSPRR